MEGPRILIVDDDPAVRGLLHVIARRCGVLADEAADGRQCLELLDSNSYDVVLLDLAMPWINGFDVIESLRGKPLRPAVIVITALTRWNFVGIEPGVVHCILRKPFDLDMAGVLIASAATVMYERRTLQRAQRVSSTASRKPPEEVPTP